MRFHWLAGLGVCLAAGLAQAQNAGVALSEKSAYFTYGTLVGGQSFGRNEMNFGFLYNTNETYILHAGLEVRDEAGTRVPGLEVGVGGRFNLAGQGGKEVFAFALGGEMRYRLPQAERFALAGEFYYAPDIVTFLDARSYSTWALQAEYEILPQARIHAGYRRFEARTVGGRYVDLDKGVRVGVEVEF